MGILDILNKNTNTGAGDDDSSDNSATPTKYPITVEPESSDLEIKKSTETTETIEQDSVNENKVDVPITLEENPAEIKIPGISLTNNIDSISEAPDEKEETKKFLPNMILGTELEKGVFPTSPVNLPAPQNVEETTEPDFKQSIPKPKVKSEYRTIKNVGFVCLNTNLLNNGVSEQLREISYLLSENKTKIYIDSNKGYGLSVLDGVKRASYKNLMGVYFKPFYSNYSDFAEISIDFTEYTQYFYSNYLDRLKFLVKNVDLFIIPETGGVFNLAQLFSIWNLSNLYLGQNKPLILVGKQWDENISVIKDLLKLNTQEIQAIEIAYDSKRVLEIIHRIDKLYSGKAPVSIKKTFDMRSESDETESFIDI